MTGEELAARGWLTVPLGLALHRHNTGEHGSNGAS
jgi:hypothetical protein